VFYPPQPPLAKGGSKREPLAKGESKSFSNPKLSGLFVCDDNGIFPAKFVGSRPVFGGFTK
jgi:hypothetical protein